MYQKVISDSLDDMPKVSNWIVNCGDVRVVQRPSVWFNEMWYTCFQQTVGNDVECW